MSCNRCNLKRIMVLFRKQEEARKKAARVLVDTENIVEDSLPAEEQSVSENKIEEVVPVRRRKSRKTEEEKTDNDNSLEENIEKTSISDIVAEE